MLLRLVITAIFKQNTHYRLLSSWQIVTSFLTSVNAHLHCVLMTACKCQPSNEQHIDECADVWDCKFRQLLVQQLKMRWSGDHMDHSFQTVILQYDWMMGPQTN